MRRQLSRFRDRVDLSKTLIAREVAMRYRGSALGTAWAFINPMMLLAVYTFVFSTMFKSVWVVSDGTSQPSKILFGIMLFIGLLVHGLFSEAISRAPTLIISNSSYVKKVIFPLEILAVIVVGAASIQTFIGLTMLILFLGMLSGGLSWTIVLVPLILLPLHLVCVGLVWFFASLGVYVRDLAQVTGLIVSVSMFLSPIFYPVSSVPEPYQSYIWLNPLTYPIEELRSILVMGRSPNWMSLAMNTAGGLLIAVGGYVWFSRTRRGFSDVL